MKALITKPPPGKITLRKINNDYKTAEFYGVENLVESLKLKYNIKAKNENCIWYIINLAFENDNNKCDYIQFYHSQNKLDEHVKRTDGKRVMLSALKKLIKGLEYDGLIVYKVGNKFDDCVFSIMYFSKLFLKKLKTTKGREDENDKSERKSFRYV